MTTLLQLYFIFTVLLLCHSTHAVKWNELQRQQPPVASEALGLFSAHWTTVRTTLGNYDLEF